MDESWVIVETSASEAGDGQTNTQEDKVERELKPSLEALGKHRLGDYFGET